MKSFLFGAVFVGVIFVITTLGQTSAPMSASEKRAILLEIKELSGINSLAINNEIKDSNLANALDGVINNDKSLSQAQRGALQPALNEAKARLSKAVKDFLADTSSSVQLFGEMFMEKYSSHFTDSELKELVAFYRTPTGKKAAFFSLSFFNDVNQSFTNAWKESLQKFVDAKINEEWDGLKKKVDEIKKGDRTT